MLYNSFPSFLTVNAGTSYYCKSVLCSLSKRDFNAVLHKVIWYAKFLTFVSPCVAVFKYSQYLTIGGKILLPNASIQKPYETWSCRKLKDNFFEEKSFRLFYILSLCLLCIRSLISRYTFSCLSFVTCSCLTDASSMVFLLYWKKK